MARVVPVADLVDEAIKLGETIAVQVAPDRGHGQGRGERRLRDDPGRGAQVERRLFYATFATDDRREGMTAFVEKRSPNFTDR